MKTTPNGDVNMGEAWSPPESPPAWQPIETAPTDGTIIIGCTQGEEQSHEMCYVCGEWVEPNEEYLDYEPTHWQPMPAPPTDPDWPPVDENPMAP